MIQSSQPLLHQGLQSECNLVAAKIRAQLRCLNQEVQLHSEAESAVSETSRITTTAAFYRVAALLYLEDVAVDLSDGGKHVQDLIQYGFGLLGNMDICTSPWPLFILACYSNSDERRIRVLRMLEAMQSKRRIGNVQVLEGIIKAVWKQQDILDLSSGVARKPVDWRDLIAMTSPMPSFV